VQLKSHYYGTPVVTYQSFGRVATEERLARLARDGVEVVAKRLVAAHTTHAVLLRVTVHRIRGHLLQSRLVRCNPNAAEVAPRGGRVG